MMTAGKRADLRENSNVFFREHLPEVKSLKGPTRANAQTQNLDARPETAKGTGRKKPLTISLERYTKGRGAHKITTSTKKKNNNARNPNASAEKKCQEIVQESNKTTTTKKKRSCLTRKGKKARSSAGELCRCVEYKACVRCSTCAGLTVTTGSERERAREKQN